MEVNEEVVSQGIVFASIVTGFAFVIASQIALQDPPDKELEFPALLFLATGLMGILTAAIGVVYFGIAHDPAGQAGAGIVFLVFMAFTGVLFLLSVLSLFRRRFEGRTRWDFFAVMALIAALLMGMLVYFAVH